MATQQTWQEMVAHFEQVTDRLGKPIDAGIFETVVVLNMLGIRTLASCEGHLDWGESHPWVNIEPDMDQKYTLHRYLLQFYTHHPLDFERVLIWNGYRIRSQGAIFAPRFSSDEQAHNLRAYQEEMHAFTRFMKSLLTV